MIDGFAKFRLIDVYLTSVNDQSGSTSFVYDPLSHVTSDTRVIGTNSYGTSYTYDAAGNILTETYPSGRIVTYAT
jgi:YD repeat-containing protein